MSNILNKIKNFAYGGFFNNSERKRTEANIVQKDDSISPGVWNNLTNEDIKIILNTFSDIASKHGRACIPDIIQMMKSYLRDQPFQNIRISSENDKVTKSTFSSPIVKTESPAPPYPQPEINELTDSQYEALAVLNSGANCFITGGAGVGKSYLIEKFLILSKNSGKKILVCAPTGVAALNIGGVTIHSLFQIKVKRDIFTKKEVKQRFNEMRFFEETEEWKNPLFYANIIIIDEISMCRGDIFEMVIATIQGILRNKTEKFTKNIQLILVGDFFQLPPVLSNKKIIEYKNSMVSALDLYNNEYKDASGYAFLMDSWQGFKTCHLTEIIRQKNSDFANALNNLRIGNIDGYKWIVNNSSKNILIDGIYLCGRNRDADVINNSFLNNLSGKLYQFQMDIKILDNEQLSNKDLKEYIKVIKYPLNLKTGCKVISIINKYDGNGHMQHANGMRGKVLSIYEDKENENINIKVHFENGNQVIVTPHVWEIKKYIVDENNNVQEKTIAILTQFPLILGYAITVHRAQGQTLGAINVDEHCNFAHGQLYVALSRCPNVEKIFLKKKDYNPLTSKQVKKFYGLD